MSARSPKEGKKLEALDRLVEEITVDAYGDDEQLWAFRQAFEDDVACLPTVSLSGTRFQ